MPAAPRPSSRSKLNNIMIDDKSGEAICIIDLDTVMPYWRCSVNYMHAGSRNIMPGYARRQVSVSGGNGMSSADRKEHNK